MTYYFAVYDVWHAAVEDESIVLRAVCGEPIPREGPGPVTRDRPNRLCRGCGGGRGAIAGPRPRGDLHACPGGCGKMIADTVLRCRACDRKVRTAGRPVENLVYGDLTPEVLAWAAEHGGKVDTRALAKALITGQPGRFRGPAGLSLALARRAGSLPGAMHLAQGLYRVPVG